MSFKGIHIHGSRTRSSKESGWSFRLIPWHRDKLKRMATVARREKDADVNTIATAWEGMTREKKMTPLDWMSNSRNLIEGTGEITEILRKHSD